MTDARRSLFVLALVLSGTVLLPVAAAQNNSTNVSDKAPYYANNSTYIENESWMDNRSEPSLDNTTALFLRVGSFIVGSGIRGNNVWAGSLTLGLVFIGAALGAVAGNVGIVAGAVVAVTILSGLVSAGLAPAWLWAVALFGLGLILTGVYIKSQR